MLLSVVALVATISAYLFIRNDAIGKAEDEATMRAEISAVSNQTLDAKLTAATYKDTASKRAQLSSFLVSEDNAVPFIDSIEAIGPAAGANVSISSLSSAVDGAGHPMITATVTVYGAWSNVVRAVEMVENLQYASSIKNLSMNASFGGMSSSKTTTKWTASMDISVLSPS